MPRKAQVLAIFAPLVLVLALAPAANASSATFTYAYHDDAAWSHGSFAGSMSWDGCAEPGCTWLPLLFVNPSLPSYPCAGAEWSDSDPNTKMVYSGGSQTGNGSVTFDLKAQPILSGVYGQRICAIAVETDKHQDQICIVQAPILGMDPASCPLETFITGNSLGGKLLTDAPSPAAPITGGGGTGTPPPTVKPVVKPPLVVKTLTATMAKTAAKTALGKKFGRSYKKGTRRTLSCSRSSSTKIGCKASWHYKGKKHRGKITVNFTAGKVKAIAKAG